MHSVTAPLSHQRGFGQNKRKTENWTEKEEKKLYVYVNEYVKHRHTPVVRPSRGWGGWIDIDRTWSEGEGEGIVRNVYVLE